MVPDGVRCGRRACAALRAGAGLAFAATLLLVFAPPSRAASPSEILELRLQPCPEYEVGRSSEYPAPKVAAAKQGDFEVMSGLPAHLEPPVNWTQDPYADRSWVHYLHGFLWLDQLLYAYRAEDDLAALADARDLMLDWVAQVRPGDPAYSDEAWGDKTTGDRAPYLGYVTRAAACRGLLSDAQASTLIDAGREHGARLADPAGYVPSNHGLFVDIGLARLGLHLGFLPEASGWKGLAVNRFQRTLHGRLIPGEGLWLEHSAGYQFVTIRLVDAFAQVAGQQTALADALTALRTAAGWLVMPSERVVPWGDSHASPAPAWAVDEGAAESGLRVFARSGLAVVKDGGGYLAVTAAFHNGTHKHADDLGFHLFDRGRDVISDSGFPAYTIDKWLGFARSTAAHSVLKVDDWKFPVAEPDLAYGSGIVAAGLGDGWYAIEGRNPRLRRRGVRHRRTFLYRPGRALLILDTVRSRRRHTYTRLFQIAPGIDARVRSHGGTLSASGFKGALREQGRRSHSSAVKGQYTPPRGWSFPARRQRVPRWTVGLRDRAEDTRYLTAIGLRGAAKAQLLRARKRSLRLRFGGPALARGILSVRRRGGALVVNRRPGGPHARKPDGRRSCGRARGKRLDCP